jgi:hypothetical protein
MKEPNVHPWSKLFPATDLHEYLTTQQLLDAWYLLAGEHIAVLVDTVKPRVSKVFAFGKFGTLQQLLCDMETFQEAGRRGIRAVYYRGETRFTPLKDKPYVFDDTPSERIAFDARRRTVAIDAIQCCGPDLQPDSRLDFGVSLKGDAFEVSWKAPENADRAEIEIELYPLYTDYRGAGWSQPEVIDYYCWNSRLHNPAGRFVESVPGQVELVDRHGRAPRLVIAAPGMEIRLAAFSDEERNDAHRLLVTIRGPVAGRATFAVRPNPVTVHCLPIVPAGTPQKIEIACRRKPVVTAAGKACPVRPVKPGHWRTVIRVPHGVSHLLVESADGVSDRQIAAVGDIPSWVERMGRAAAACLWDSGPVRHLVPQFIDVKRLVGKARGPHGQSQRGIAYCSHNPRALMIIVAAARQTGDRKLLDRAWLSIRAMERMAYHHEDGALVLPIGIDPAGAPVWVDAVRPSDPAIAVRSILMVRSVFLEWGDRRRAEEALRIARGFALSLLKMAGPEGQLEARYRYPTLEMTHRSQIPGRGTVNNWVAAVSDLAGILEARNDPIASQLRDLCVRHADLLVASRPSILRLAGGGEDGPNNSDALNLAAGFFLIKHRQTGDPVWAERARQAFLMAALNNTMLHIDQPQNFFFTFDWTESIWHDGPMNVMSKGGMHDLTSCDVGMAMVRYLDDRFAREMCAYQFLARLVDGVYENGAVLNRVTAMPNFQLVKTDFTETLNFGAVGVLAFYWGVGFARLSELEMAGTGTRARS